MPKFYPKVKSVQINPLQFSQNLEYILEMDLPEPNRNLFKVKFAFPAKLPISDNKLKTKVKNILVKMIDAANFEVSPTSNGVLVEIPIRPIDEKFDLNVKIPLLVKLSKAEDEFSAGAEVKCIQEIHLLVKNVQIPDDSEKDDDVDFSDDETEDAENQDVKETEEEEEKDGRDWDSDFYSGLISIDYGTSNSTVAVRDPCFAAEEVKGQLGQEQWHALCDWMNIWLTKHLASDEPSQLDVFVQNLTLVVPNAEIPECGSPESEVEQSLKMMDDVTRAKILTELISRLSSDSATGTKVMKTLASEALQGFEAVIDANSLESQRYFILELDKNIGPAPISSVLQIVSFPATNDETTLVQESKVDMGARVNVLLHSAALGQLDIRQFVLSSKRYFGSDDNAQVVPAESNDEVIEIPGELLAKLTYKQLLERAVADIHRRAQAGLFQDATWARSVVATFPTTYPAVLRKGIREILSDLGIQEIDTRFDEATAAAIYYIWREIGADPVCGMHGLMARSRKDKHDRSYQNILLYDLGGGTTDIALIQLLYEEVGIFKEGDDRGNGGCYFRITPRLLGTTGHRHLGGDLLTLWFFRFIKSRLADLLLQHLLDNNIEPPMDNPLHQLLLNLPEEICEDFSGEDEMAKYRKGALLEWTVNPTQLLREYNQLNENIIDVLIPTRFADDRSKVPNFFTLWEITDEAKKTLGTPIVDNFGTCLSTGLPDKWPQEVEIDSGQLYNFMQLIHPWLVDSGKITQDNLLMLITQEEMNGVIADALRLSLSLAASLAKARLQQQKQDDKIDRLILAGLSCNMKAIQDQAEEVFRDSDGVFDYDPANVKFDRDSAKTAVSLGACIGRYMESVRVDPFNEKTRQLLRDGYDQIELVIENLFSYLPCRIAYDSLVAMVPIFEQGQELNVKSYWDKDKIVARTSIKELRPVQEKFWIYRIDFPGAEPQYLGLINTEEVAYENGFDNFRKFREEFVVGFEIDAELMLRCFFLPKNLKIVAKDYVEPSLSNNVAGLITGTGEIVNEDELKEKIGVRNEPEETEDYDDATEPDEEKVNDATEDMEEDDDIAEELDDEEAEAEEDDDIEEELEEEEEDEEEDEDGEEDNEKEEEESEDSEMPKNKIVVPDEKLPKKDLKFSKPVLVRERLEDISQIRTGEDLNYFIEYEDGTVKQCGVSHSMSIRDEYEFIIGQPEEEEEDYDEENYDANTEDYEDGEGDEDDNEEVEETNDTPQQNEVGEEIVFAKFDVDDREVEEATFVCDEDQRKLLLTKCLFDISIWADIEFVHQKTDINYDPFCGQH